MRTYTFSGLVPSAVYASHERIVRRGLLAVDSSLANAPQFEDVCEALLQSLYRDGRLNYDDTLTFGVRVYRAISGVLVARVVFYATCDDITFTVGAFVHTQP